MPASEAWGMRFRVEVPDEDEEPLRTLARRDFRGDFKKQAAYLLHLKVQEEIARLLETDAAASPI